MILVTLGTHPKPMDRLMVAIERLIESGDISEPVIIQSASYGFRPKGADLHQLVAVTRLHEWASTASVIITHGGPASITLAMSMGRRPIVVPRDPRFQEHVDNHQILFTRWLAQRRPIIVVEDPSADLRGALLEASVPAKTTGVGTADPHAIDRLRRIIEGDR